MVTDLDRLKIELEMKKAISNNTKDVIKAWMNRAYELGVKDAGRIISESLSKQITKFAQQKHGE